MKRFVLQPSMEESRWWIATDTINGIVVKFKEHEFNETQKITFLDDVKSDSALELAKKAALYMREIADWLQQYHGDIVSAKRSNKEEEFARLIQQHKDDYNAVFTNPRIATPSTIENIRILLLYLNDKNWGAWELPAMEIGYTCNQYDCDGRIATTITLDRRIDYRGRKEKRFVVGAPRGHLSKYQRL